MTCYFRVDLIAAYSKRRDLADALVSSVQQLRQAEAQIGEPAFSVRSTQTFSRWRVNDRLSQADMERLVTAFTAGTSKRKLAERYGISESSVKRLIRRHGASKPSSGLPQCQRVINQFGHWHCVFRTFGAAAWNNPYSPLEIVLRAGRHFMPRGLEPWDPSAGVPGPTSGSPFPWIPPGQPIPSSDPRAWALDQQARAEAALAARRTRMSGRWFTAEHMWVAIDGKIATVGLTDYAASELGDIVYVSLPAVGSTVIAEEPCGQVESTKAISELYAPVDGEVTEVNEELDADPGLINAGPWDVGWMYRVRLAVGSDAPTALPVGLLSPAEYEDLLIEGYGQ